MTQTRDHGGGLDAAIARFGGTRTDWLDLSTGINPVPYPVGDVSPAAWTALPDSGATARLEAAARRFWNIPDKAAVIATAGASAVIARLPATLSGGQVYIPGPTYNEHAAAFAAHGWQVLQSATEDAAAQVFVHPNNPDGRLAPTDTLAAHPFTLLDESFCDVTPAQSLIARTATPGTVVLKSFGKFWGLAGLRLGFAIGHPDTFAPEHGKPALADLLGPWSVAGPALEIGARALSDDDWAGQTRTRLDADATRLDALMRSKGAEIVGGTTLFRLYAVPDAADWQARLAQGHVWSRIFPYSQRWLRLGLPAPDRWGQLEAAL